MLPAPPRPEEWRLDDIVGGLWVGWLGGLGGVGRVWLTLGSGDGGVLVGCFV